MAIDPVLLGFAYSAGAASFFSPCSVGLLPAYMGYFLGADDPRQGSDVASGVFRGAGLGLVASLGFFLLFLGVGLVVASLGTAFLGPYLVWISRAIGVAIILLGVLLLSGRSLTISPRVRFSPKRSIPGLFAFGAAYGLASLGCTLPVFVAVVLGAFSAPDPLGGVATLGAYGFGMATFMVLVSVLLGGSRDGAQQFLSRIVPHVKRASGAILLAAGTYILYYYTVVIA